MIDTNFELKTRANFHKFYDVVEMPGGYSFSHTETLKLIDLYYNSKYKTGSYDNLGLRKFFYNIVKPAVDVAAKFIDVDTGNIMVLPEGEEDELPTWFMQKRLRLWLDESGFGEILNEITTDLPKYGTVVLKKSKEGVCKVNLHNLILDPAGKSLDCMPFVYERIYMNRHEIDEMGWDTSELYDRGDDDSFIIYECYNRRNGKWVQTIYGDLFTAKESGGYNRAVESEINDRTTYAGAIMLSEKEVKELPYRELHWERIPGRWLGYGFVEYLEENQIAINEAENLERKGLMFTSLKLYQTRDEAIGGSNVLTNAQNGDILFVSSEITPVAVEERNLAAFNNTRSNWSQNTERKTFTTDITTGASLPSRTPLGVANLQASLASSYFELKRENFGLFIKKLLMEDIIPDFSKDTAEEHTLLFGASDKDIARLDMMVANQIINDKMVEYALKTGFFPSKEEREIARLDIMESLRKNQTRFVKVAKNTYKNAKYHIKVEITGEGIDTNAKSQILQMVLQIIGTNPAVMENENTKRIIFAMLSMGNISPVEIGLLDQPAQPQGQVPPEVAGSLARPQAPTTQMSGNSMIL